MAWLRRSEDPVDRVRREWKIPQEDSDTPKSGEVPWYDRGSFWGLVSAAISLLSIYIATITSDVRWLLLIVWVLLSWAALVACKGRRGLFAAIAIILALTMIEVSRTFIPKSSVPVTVEAIVKGMPRPPTAAENAEAFARKLSSQTQQAKSSQPPEQPQPPKIHIIFKNSPLLTPARTARITQEIDGYRNYLLALGFDAPSDVPPIGTVPGDYNTSAAAGPEQLNGSIEIGGNMIDDPMAAIAAYNTFAFPRILDCDNRSRLDLAFRQWSSVWLSIYFNWSYSGHPSIYKGRVVVPRKNTWEAALWQIRNELGKSFTDQSLFYMVKRLDNLVADRRFQKSGDNYSVSTAESNTYFYQGFLLGESIVDNHFSSLSRIGAILKSNGLMGDAGTP
jgi:hypothetical protein